MYIVLSERRARQWIKGLAKYLAIFSRREESSVVQSQLDQNNRAYILRRDQDQCEIAEYHPQVGEVDNG